MGVVLVEAGEEVGNYFFGLKYLRRSELETTDTELIAMASPASSGLSVRPYLVNNRAAIGIPMIL